MAIRFSGSAGGYYSTAGMPTSVFTISFWFYLVSAPAGDGIIWSLDSTTSQYVYLGTRGSPPQLVIEWAGGGTSDVEGPVITTGVWYKINVTISGAAAYLDVAAAGSPIVTYQVTSGFTFPTGTLKFWIGDSIFGTNFVNCRIASFKMWNADIGTRWSIEQEMQCYLPQRTANLSRWHPFLKTETVDYSGNGRTLSGGTAATTEPGPPISWSKPRVSLIPWDPTTTVWYAHYDTITGELIALGTVYPDPFPSDTAVLEILNQPDQSEYEWSVSARSFVRREGVITVDRVEDLVGDATLSTVWSTLDSTQDQALKDRIGQMLGSQRYRQSFQSPDLD